uniref:putative ankyrin repeat domain-containing protein 26-like protein n=1 Tax=Callithrix jacchus TaxID=9483 RepID=UPI0023DCF816|nr:putative ankyrin repeat domain-containing protein 26-like protein [Callithrix jacchus]
MKRISGSQDQKGQGPSGFFTCWWRSSRGDVAERDDSTFAQRGYNIRGKHLGKLHRAASRGDVFRVQLILMRGNVDLDERDKKKRRSIKQNGMLGRRSSRCKRQWEIYQVECFGLQIPKDLTNSD